MNDAEGRVTVLDVVHEDANCVDVVDLGQIRALALHLLPDAADVLRPAAQIGLDPGRCKCVAEDAHCPPDVRLAGLAARLELLGETPELGRIEDLEGEVLELPLDLPDAKALR